MMEMRTIIMYLFGNYDVSLENPGEVKNGSSEAVLKPEGGLRVKLKQRVNATAQAKLAMDAVLA